MLRHHENHVSPWLCPGVLTGLCLTGVLKRAMSAATHCDIPLAMVEILYHVFSESGRQQAPRVWAPSRAL